MIGQEKPQDQIEVLTKTVKRLISTVDDLAEEVIPRLEHQIAYQDGMLNRYEAFFEDMKAQFLQDIIKQEVEFHRSKIKGGDPGCRDEVVISME